MPEPAQGSSSESRADQQPGTFHYRLREAMEARGMSQNELAAALGSGTGTLTGWLQDGTWPSGRVVVRIPEALRIDGHWLLTGEGEMEKPAPNVGTGGIGERERLDLLRLLGFVQQVVASGPVGSTELVEDLKALASVLHVVQLERQLPPEDPPRQG